MDIWREENFPLIFVVQLFLQKLYMPNIKSSEFLNEQTINY